MNCKKCGKGTMIKQGDYYVCDNCGAKAIGVVKDETANETINRSANEQDVEMVSTVVEDTPDGEVVKEEKEPKSKLREVLDFMFPIVLAVIIAVVLKTCIFANAIVPTGSMINTIQINDRIIGSRLTYKFDDPQRYDIILFKFPDNEKEVYIKRIIGMPGDTVEVVNGVVYVTDKDGKTQQLRDDFVTNEVPVGNYGPYHVPDDCYFMMGDNRNDSVDSRYWNNTFVARDKIIGKAMYTYYPHFSKLE